MKANATHRQVPACAPFRQPLWVVNYSVHPARTGLQVTSVFARRGYNVQSLAVGASEREGRSRICMMVPGTQVRMPNE